MLTGNKYDMYVAKYSAIYSSRGEEELEELSQIKRFLEVYCGDEALRRSIDDGSVSLRDAAALAGVTIDVSTLTPAFQPGLALSLGKLDEKQWPMAAKWRRYINELLDMRQSMLSIGDTNGKSPAFDRWRKRQVRRAAADLGVASHGIVHPPIAFELSSGCSVGCWFCGVSAKKFGGHYSLTGSGRDFWHGIVSASQDVLGDGLKSGFLYWATDPLDNPEYPDFLDVFRECSGGYPQTTTAIPLRHLENTKSVLSRWSPDQGTPNRFSILNTKILRQVHTAFSARELLNTEMVLQNFGNTATSKTNVGRTLEATKAGGTLNTRRSTVSEGTIACVTGFLVNIVERTIRLVSPCMPSEKWPDGFIVFAEDRFTDVDDYRAKLLSIIDKMMPMGIQKDDPLKLSENFYYHFNGSEHVLETPSTTIASSAVDLFAPHFDEGGTSASTLLQRAIASGANIFAVVDAIEKSRDAGLLDIVIASDAMKRYTDAGTVRNQ